MIGGHTPGRKGKSRSVLLRRSPAWFAASVVMAVCCIGLADRAAAYRPFDGTDAAVADIGEVEIEFQPAGVIRSPSATQVAGPNAVFNYGFAERWELVLQTVAQGFPPDAGPMNVSNAAFLKYVIKPGVLQDKPGVASPRSSARCLPTSAARALASAGPPSPRNAGTGGPCISTAQPT
jgi:hypothetical protein